jgi:hypothetical protein
MARRRTRIKDINVFKQTKATEEPTNSSEQTDEKGKIMAEDRTEADNVDTSVSLNESDVDDFAGLAAEAELAAGQPPSDLAGASEDLPTNESDFDLAASLGAEAAAATPDDDNLGLPPALETPPDDIGLDLPTGESDLADIEPGSADFDDLVESDLGLPVAMDQPAADIDFGFPPAMETPAAGPADFNFESAFDPQPQPTTAQPDLPDFPPAMMTDLPPAMDTPPADIPASPSLADLPIGEAGFGDMANLPVGEAGFDSSTDFPSGEAGLDMPAETLPSGEAGLGTSAPYSLPNETYNTMPGSGTTSPYESSAPIPVDMPVDSSPRPVPPPETSSSLPVPPQTGGTLAVSNTIPLTLDDDSPRDIFDFMGVTNEPQTITYQIPEDIEELTVEERKRRMLLLKDNRVREQFDKIYHAVDSEYEHLLDSNISSNKEITDWAQNLLAETRYILMNYQIEHLAKAEWNIQQVRARLDRAEESERWRQKWGWLIIIWGVVWFFIFVILIFNPTPLPPRQELAGCAPERPDAGRGAPRHRARHRQRRCSPRGAP